MKLTARQSSFIAEIAAPDDGPECASPGMAIYRNAYRARLADALATSFERTRRWVGDDMFGAASAHYILTHPPSSWTLDDYGDGFPETLAGLFGEDPEVAELAWLEWHMQRAFAAPDGAELTAAKLAAAAIGESEWEALRLAPPTGFACRAVAHDLSALWHGLAGDAAEPPAPPAKADHWLLVWRQGFVPRFRLLDSSEFSALGMLLDGHRFGKLVEQLGADEIGRLGQWFAQWLAEGLFSGCSIAQADSGQ